MSLETGRYLIYTKDGNLPVGYNPSSGLGVDEKLEIYTFPTGSLDILSVWGVERGGGRSSQGEQYQLTAYPVPVRGGSNTSAWRAGSSAEGHLWVFASPSAGESWLLTRIGQNGPDNTTKGTFTVTNANGDGWAVDKPSMHGPDSDEKPVHVAVRQLATNPASHPPNEVFIFKKLE